MSKRKYIRAICEQGESIEFVEFLLRSGSLVVENYAKVFCLKRKIKPLSRSEAEHDERLIDLIHLAHVKWLDS